ncbi:hypothetical protein RAA17_14390 [Komagataeibacter rhaeticus]|nr:hypothetical protein [Komagataeibacter rhaeticus]
MSTDMTRAATQAATWRAHACAAAGEWHGADGNGAGSLHADPHPLQPRRHAGNDAGGGSRAGGVRPVV